LGLNALSRAVSQNKDESIMNILLNNIRLCTKVIAILCFLVNPSILLSQLISSFDISPSYTTEIDTITITANGETSNSAICLVDSNVVVNDTLIQINLYFEWIGEAGLTVMTPYSYSFTPIILNPGNYMVQCNSFYDDQLYDYADTVITINSYTDIVQNNLSIKEGQLYELSQNYPNPFNPKTIIHYSLKVPNDVSLKIYNLAGQEIETLVNNSYHMAGQYTVTWQPRGLSTGIYFYKIQTGEYTEIKKLQLQK
jgi:hypothetical protein